MLAGGAFVCILTSNFTLPVNDWVRMLNNGEKYCRNTYKYSQNHFLHLRSCVEKQRIYSSPDRMVEVFSSFIRCVHVERNTFETNCLMLFKALLTSFLSHGGWHLLCQQRFHSALSKLVSCSCQRSLLLMVMEICIFLLLHWWVQGLFQQQHSTAGQRLGSSLPWTFF